MNTEEDVVFGVVCEDNEDNRITVVDIVKGSPAERAGLRPGGVILEIGGSKVQSVEALVDCVERLKGRDKLEIVLIRAGGDDTPEKMVIGLKG
jgi:C-terminal processing protease CtpA/Prc